MATESVVLSRSAFYPQKSLKKVSIVRFLNLDSMESFEKVLG